MGGTIKYQEGAVVTLTSSGAQLTTGSAGLAGVLDCRSSGGANTADMLAALFSMSAQVAANTGITAGTTLVDLYLVPSLDGTNFPDIDTTAGASYIPFPLRKGFFVFPKVPTANTTYLFQSDAAELMPVKYNVYIINRSGQTINAGWALNALATAAQYT